MRTNVHKHINITQKERNAYSRKQARSKVKSQIARNKQKRDLLNANKHDGDKDTSIDKEISMLEKSEETIQSLNRINEFENCRRTKTKFLEDLLKRSGGDGLVMSNMLLKKIPNELMSSSFKLLLSHLIVLDLSDNQLEFLPGLEFIFHLSTLRKMNLSSNKMRILPPEISALENLEIFHIMNNQLESFPKEISSLSTLQYLNLSNNKVESISDELCSLRSLKYLIADTNSITLISNKIGDMVSLETLQLGDNQISWLPQRFPTLINLKHLDLSKNCLTEIPLDFGQLYDLRYVDISYNSLLASK